MSGKPGTGPPDGTAARERIRSAALDLGFATVGFAPAEPPAHADAYLAWLRAGHHADMQWMAREDSVRRRLDPREALAGCRTLVVVTLAHPDHAPPDHAGPGDAIVARYALGLDYHDVFEEKLAALEAVIREADPGAECKPYVDYGPVLERDHAQRAGLGWIGKNTLLIDPRLGSWLLLGELLTTMALPPDEPFLPDRCGSCTRCMEACPTGAIVEERVLDSRLCISWLTIENRGAIPEELRAAIGGRVFGCDICQEVCPWNLDPAPADRSALVPGRPVAPRTMAAWVELLLTMDETSYRERFRGTALARPGRDGMLRNLCVGLGNEGEVGYRSLLERCLTDESELVREHARWALSRSDF
ncbi:MAG: tRNA epoxyqueuosine(34) reductase QueG [marine benthic group bacterium]|nr:tRNA epoxyqueuosine(34) reductase QueG [Gemmatimonadota bacterium]MCL7962058.1 tRNA epoxyqueuosine(34) reductase QueG [Candidatus Carthagonibacter metallireducens]MCL7957312.1 tRNA epoxyqueuosine(34) reductase QueG [Gemmatimonadota bacterium]MCL7964180.1 tRNA epoxyqueuosine(34) reductase QueG [Gemmatimonadota bacterium]MCL7966685.1 tRNA epoxyqueuosine(34) reductase QueG [Gemmatimonadota bacterium]